MSGGVPSLGGWQPAAGAPPGRWYWGRGWTSPLQLGVPRQVRLAHRGSLGDWFMVGDNDVDGLPIIHALGQVGPAEYHELILP